MKMTLKRKFAVILVFIGVSFAFMQYFTVPKVLELSYQSSVYTTLKNSLDAMIVVEDSISEDIKATQYFVIGHDQNKRLEILPEDFYAEALLNSSRQKGTYQKYIFEGEDFRIFYVIEAFLNFEGEEVYVVAFQYDYYFDSLMIQLKVVLMYMTIVFSIFILIFANVLAAYFVNPLKQIIAQVKKISERKWHQKLDMPNNGDEISTLADEIECMRLELIRQESLQKEMFQNISHDLKTPIMVIKSYVECIQEGFYPKNNMYDSLDVVLNETNRLSEKVNALLHLSKLNYLQNEDADRVFNMNELIESIASRFRFQRKEVEWLLDLEEIEFRGNIKLWETAVENILQNCLRYANKTIKITVKEEVLIIYNDGKSIEKKIVDKLFVPYQKGIDGEFGLGLSIVKKTLDLYNYKINIENEEVGVTFKIESN